MDDAIWVQVASAASDIATAVAITGAGIWAFYRFIIKREYREVVKMQLQWKTEPYDNECQLVSFDATLENTGPVIIQAQPRRSPAYKDKFETLNYSADLIIRKIPHGLQPGTAIKWGTGDENESPLPTDIELDLLYDYYQFDGRTQFWLEPGEDAVMSANVILEPGYYLALFTFVGRRQEENFWRRLYPVHVPETPPTVKSNA